MADLLAAVRTARDQTVAANTARITYSTDFSWWSLPPFPARRRGPVRRVALGVGKAAAKGIGRGAFRLATRRTDPRHRTAEGILDLAGRRSMLDFGSYAQVQIGTQHWSGRSGPRPGHPPRLAGTYRLAAVANRPARRHPHRRGSGHRHEVSGEQWRHVAATANLAEASAARAEGMPSPARNRFEDLLALPVELWLDGPYLRRIRFVSDRGTNTITLTDSGVDPEELDWSRLPTFRSPEEEQAVATHESRPQPAAPNRQD